jgi:hypothetical protein
LLTVSTSKVFTRAAATPDWDKILIIVNDTLYGGSGGSVLVGSLDTSSVNVIQHEFGHTFMGLADEYSTAYPGFPLCSDFGSFPNCEPNVTDQTNRALTKWTAWIDPSTTIPTPTSDHTHVGLFLGARYQSAGFYRPKYDCLMNHLGVSFCEICRQAFVLRLYNGWGGSPLHGIDLIEPGTETPSPSSPINTTAGATVAFTFTLLQPVGGPAASIQWSVDGLAKGGATTTHFNYQPSQGTHTVSVVVTDTTTAVKNAGTSLQRTRSWSVVAAPGVTPPKRRAARH